MKVSIITPVWNHVDQTANFLYRNWGLYQSRPLIEFVIIDNGSTDGTPALLKQWQQTMGERLVTYRYDDNQGYGPANNHGAKLATGDVLVFINNDTTPQGDYISCVAEALNDSPGAMVGAELINFDTGWNVFNGQLIEYLTGWCFACRKETWVELGGFDEQFIPCDYEDMDLSVRAKNQERQLIPLKLPLIHLFGRTADFIDGGRLAITYRNQELFKQKWGFA